MRKKIIFSLLLMCLICPLDVSLTLSAEQPVLSREQIIAREMDCVSRHLNSDKNMGWADVCTTSDRGAYDYDEEIGLTKITASSRNAAFDDSDLPEKKKWYAVHPALTRENSLTQFEAGTEVYYYDYREPGLMKDQGMMYGIYGSYTYRTSENEHIKDLKDIFSETNKINVFKLDLRLALGEVDYESNGTGTMEGIDYFTFEGRGLLGYDIPIRSNSRVTPFLGLGWRYLKDDGGGKTSSTGHWAYDRESEYFYFPMGLEANTRKENDWDISLTMEYDYLISGKQTSHLEDGGISVCDSGTSDCYALDPLKNDQEKGYGLRGSLKMVKRSEKIDFVLEPFVRYWNIDKSKEKQLSSLGGSIVWYGDPDLTRPVTGYEPENETLEYGVKIGLRY